LRILAVDDNEDAVVMLAKLLRYYGHDARCCTSGAQALKMGHDFEPDAVVLDLGMPGMDGFETAERLKQQSWGKSVFLIALTGWGRDDDVRRTLAAGFDEHLVKPLEIDRLIDLLAQR
jgi:CheY-like chemotaxis protein